VFSKLKKSPVVLHLYKNTLQNAKPDTNKSVNLMNTPERSSVSDETYKKVVSLLNKYNMPSSFKVDMINEYKGPIQAYYRYMELFNNMDAYNVVFTKEEREALQLTMRMPSDIEQFMLFNTSYPKEIQEVTFTNLLNKPGLVFEYVTKPDAVDQMFKNYAGLIETNIKAFLFKNSRMGTNISPDRIKLFKLDFINSYKVSLYYILQPYTGDMELTNAEFQKKLQTILVPERNPDQLREFEIKKKQNANTTFIPDSYFYLHYNEFQFIKVIVKKKED
jgi:hypothetical protein